MNARSSVAALVAAILTLLLAAPAFAQGDAPDTGTDNAQAADADADADAEDGPDAEDAQTAETARQMHRYFRREKGGGIGFMTVGGASIIGGGILLLQDSDTVKGVGYPMIGVGILSAVVGAVVYLRTDDQVAALDKLLADDPATFKAQESKRMERVTLGLDIAETVEAVLILGGLSMAVIGKVDKNDTLRGYGLGLAGEAAALLVMDSIATHRATPYIQAIEKLEADDKGQARANGVSGAVAGLVLSF